MMRAGGSTRAPHGWVWRFRLCGRTPANRWLRVEVDVAGPYRAASQFARYVSIWRGGARPLLLGVQRVRAASPAPERAPNLFDVRF